MLALAGFVKYWIKLNWLKICHQLNVYNGFQVLMETISLIQILLILSIRIIHSLCLKVYESR